MIEELDNPYISYEYGYGGPSREEVIAKINEIIRYINSKERLKERGCFAATPDLNT